MEDEGIAAVLLTLESIRTLQRELYRKAKQDSAFRFYALYDKVYRADVLSHAYCLVRANRGSAGVDGVTFRDIRVKEGEAAFLAELKEALKTKTYKASPVKRVMIPKGDGSMRPLGIPTIRDRVVQMAVKLVIEPIFEADFCDNSYGFRPKKSAHDAIDDIAHALHKGYTKVIDADLSKYFDTIPHSNLMATVAERISDGSILRLIRMWLKAPVVEEDENGTKRHMGGKGNRKGTPQGGVISPLLANLYLHLPDRIWEGHQLDKRLGAHLVRTLNKSKTRMVNASQECFDFLGFELRIARSWRTGNLYPNVRPSRKSLKTIKTRLTAMTRRGLTRLPLKEVVENVNLTLRGWTAYFHYRNCSEALSQVREHAEQRLRTHLRRRHKIKDRGTGYLCFTGSSLYTKHGLYKVPTRAGRTKVHALR